MKATPGVYICDDGFALGIAYLLKLFRQVNQFDSLNWFSAVKHNFEREMMQQVDKPEKKESKKVVDSKKTQDKMFQLKSAAYQKEIEWLYFTFTASQQVLKDD